MRSAVHITGSAITVEPVFMKTNPIKALALLDKGSEFIDSAVEMDSDNFIVRILRLTNGIEVSISSPLKRCRFKMILNGSKKTVLIMVKMRMQGCITI